ARSRARDARLGPVTVVPVVTLHRDSTAGAGVARVRRGARHRIVARAAARRVDAAGGRRAAVDRASLPVVAVGCLALAGMRRQAVLVQRAQVGVHAVRVAGATVRQGCMLAAGGVAARVRGAVVSVVAVGWCTGPARAGAAGLEPVAGGPVRAAG